MLYIKELDIKWGYMKSAIKQLFIGEKIRRTTFGIVSSHIISTTMLFPLFWLIAGLLVKALLIQNKIILEPFVSFLYYLIMLSSYYLGIKYSLYFIDKKVEVALPEQSARQAIITFSTLVVVSNYALFYFQETIYIQRIVFSLLLIYMFSVITRKYFHSLEKSDYIECKFFLQVIILIANFSVLISILMTYAILHESHFAIRMILVSAFIPIMLIFSKVNIVDKIFIPFEYKTNEPKPIKKALITLGITIPVNMVLIYFIIISI